MVTNFAVNLSPRVGGPVPGRSFTPVQKLEHVAAYEAATTRGQGGAYLRGEGLYASQIAEWRKLRDAGVLTGKEAGSRIGRLAAEQAEIARLRRRLETTEARLAQTQVALEIMGKARELLEHISESSEHKPPHGTN